MPLQIPQQTQLREFGEGFGRRLVLSKQRVQPDRNLGQVRVSLIADFLAQHIGARLQTRAVFFEATLQLAGAALFRDEVKLGI